METSVALAVKLRWPPHLPLRVPLRRLLPSLTLRLLLPSSTLRLLLLLGTRRRRQPG